MKDADVEAQLNGGSNSHIFIKERYFYEITYTTGEITQVTEHIGKHKNRNSPRKNRRYNNSDVPILLNER